MECGEGFPARIEESILVDEIGIETGRHGGYFLKTLYRPVFRNGPGGVVPCAVEGLVEPRGEFRSVIPEEFLDEVKPEDRPFVECLCTALHLRNHRNIGVDEGLLGIFIGREVSTYCDERTVSEQVESIARCVADAGLDPAFVVFEIGERIREEMLRRLAEELRRVGIRIAICDFGMGEATLSRMKLLDPDVVKLNGAWFRRIAEVPVAARLLASLVGALQREGRQVLIDGIETFAQLRVALDTGADLLEGNLLGRPRIAGSIFDMDAINVEGLFSAADKVILFAANRNDQSR